MLPSEEVPKLKAVARFLPSRFCTHTGVWCARTAARAAAMLALAAFCAVAAQLGNKHTECDGWARAGDGECNGNPQFMNGRGVASARGRVRRREVVVER